MATSLVEMDRSAGFTYSDSTNPLSSRPSSGIYAKTISRSNRNFWKKFDEENSSRKLRAPVTSTDGRKRKSAARGGPTRRRVFGGCLWPNEGQISFNSAAPDSYLNDCHPRPVNAYPGPTQEKEKNGWARNTCELGRLGRCGHDNHHRANQKPS